MKLLMVLILAISFTFEAKSQAGMNAPPTPIGGRPFVISKDAVSAGIDGVMLVLAEIHKDGTVKSAEVIAGPSWPCDSTPSKELAQVRQAVEENVKAAKFMPGMKNGKEEGGYVFLGFAVGDAYKAALKEHEARKAINSGKHDVLVNLGVVNGRALRLTAPLLPSGGRFHGTIKVSTLIDETGKVVAAGAQSGPWAYQKAVRAAACDSKFSPTSISGMPVKVSGIINYNFVPY